MQSDEVVVNQRDVQIVTGRLRPGFGGAGQTGRLLRAGLSLAFQLGQIHIVPPLLLGKKLLDQEADADADQVGVVARDLGRTGARHRGRCRDVRDP